MTNLPGLNFQLGEDIDALRDAVRDFAQAEIAPRAAEIDKTDQFPMDLWEKMGSLGVLGITVPEEFGGANMGYLAHHAKALSLGGRQQVDLEFNGQHTGAHGHQGEPGVATGRVERSGHHARMQEAMLLGQPWGPGQLNVHRPRLQQT